MSGLIDYTTWVYIVIAFISTYGLGLFGWWWWKMGKATEIYIYITVMFLGIGISSAIGIYSRIIYALNNPYYDYFIKSFWWSVGPLVVLSSLVAINIRMTRRVYLSYKYNDGTFNERRVFIRCSYCGRPVEGCKHCLKEQHKQKQREDLQMQLLEKKKGGKTNGSSD